MPYQTHYESISQAEIQAHAAWYESITIVDEKGIELPVVLLDDTSIDYDNDRAEV